MRLVPRSVPAVAGATRVAVIVAGVLAVFYFGLSPGAPPSARDRWAALQNRWDTGFYVGIASGGYRHAGTPAHFDDVAFFPAFPLVLRVTALVFRVPRTPNAWAWTGALVSCALFILACVFLYRVASQQPRGDPFGAVLFCALYPFALFFSASYTESLFLLCCLASYDSMLRSRPLPAACWGLVAGLTRPPGWLLSIRTDRRAHPDRSTSPRRAPCGGRVGSCRRRALVRVLPDVAHRRSIRMDCRSGEMGTAL